MALKGGGGRGRNPSGAGVATGSVHGVSLVIVKFYAYLILPPYHNTVLRLDEFILPAGDSGEPFIHNAFLETEETITFHVVRRFPTPRKHRAVEIFKSVQSRRRRVLLFPHNKAGPNASTAGVKFVGFRGAQSHRVRSKGTCCTMGSKLLLCGLRSAGVTDPCHAGFRVVSINTLQHLMHIYRAKYIKQLLSICCS